MKKIMVTFIIIALLVAGGIWAWNSAKQNNTSNYQTQRNSINTQIKTNSSPKVENNKIEPVIKEAEVSVFSTKIYNKDEERQNNIGITCRAISLKEIQPGAVFSFCDTVGKATLDKGYKEADIYVDGKKEQGIGGGMCQVSTTLYNAVLQVPELQVVERHEHSGKVPYVQHGKDAAIAYGSYDFKFKNNSSNVIKIVMENTTDNITARIIKIEK